MFGQMYYLVVIFSPNSFPILTVIGLMQSKKTSVMSTPKCLGAHFWQIYLADLQAPVETSSGQEWQFQTSIIKAHIGRSSGRSTSHRSASGSEWQFHIMSSYWQFNWQIYPQGRSASASEWQFHISTVRVLL